MHELSALERMNVYRETIQQFFTPQWTIRVWREAQDGVEVASRHDDDISERIMSIVPYLHLDAMAKEILSMDRVAAVEVKDLAGNGGVFYRAATVKLADGRVMQVI